VTDPTGDATNTTQAPPGNDAPPVQVSPAPKPPPPELIRQAPTPVKFLGKIWPGSTLIERSFWAFGLVCSLIVLYLSGFYLTPDARGIGTHEQLGLPPCGFVEMFDGVPCPSCGYTTTFTLAAHGRPVDAFVNQPFGFMVFLATVAGVPFLCVAVGKNISLFSLTERWRWGWIGVGFVVLWILGWIYKWRMLSP